MARDIPSAAIDTRRPRLALPFTVMAAPDRVRLVAGEDFRYTLDGAGIERWLPTLLARCDGRQTLAAVLDACQAPRRDVLAWIERLYGERVLVDGAGADAHVAASWSIHVEGAGEVAARLRADAAGGPARPLVVFCQDRLDFDAALRLGRAQRQAQQPWLWINSGAMSRGWVSPVFLPDAGPCIACLVHAFAQRSPLPTLYDELIAHARDGGAVAPVPFSSHAARMLAALAEWKVAQLALAVPAAAVYQLHVVEAATMEASTHRVFRDPRCGECAGSTA